MQHLSLPPWQGGYVFGSVFLSVFLSVSIITQKAMNGLRILRRGPGWEKEQVIRFWWRFRSTC